MRVRSHCDFSILGGIVPKDFLMMGGVWSGVLNLVNDPSFGHADMLWTLAWTPP